MNTADNSSYHSWQPGYHRASGLGCSFPCHSAQSDCRPFQVPRYHDNRIDRAHLEGIHVADIAVLQTLQDFRRWKREGKLVNYKSASFEDLLESEKDFDGAYICGTLSQSTDTHHYVPVWLNFRQQQTASAHSSSTQPRPTHLMFLQPTPPSRIQSSSSSSSSPIPTTMTRSPTSSP